MGPFYPAGTAPGEFLAVYAESFATAEVDSTFYAIPARRTVEGWDSRTPDGFLFALKVPGTVTHGQKGERPRLDRVLSDEEGQLEVFLERVALLGGKLGCIVFQFPYFRVKEFSLREFLPRLEATLSRLPDGVRAAVEIRNRTWLQQEYLALLQSHGAASVLVDHPYMPSPEEQLALGMITTDFSYVRLLGDRYGIEKKTTTWDRVIEDKSGRLGRWSSVIAEIASRPSVERLLAFSNNHYAGHAPATSRELASLLGVPLKPDEPGERA